MVTVTIQVYDEDWQRIKKYLKETRPGNFFPDDLIQEKLQEIFGAGRAIVDHVSEKPR